jgi:thiosulfate/3-mercaptopyruvate sulfurtransferase
MTAMPQKRLGNRFLSSIFAFMRLGRLICWTLASLATVACSTQDPQGNGAIDGKNGNTTDPAHAERRPHPQPDQSLPASLPRLQAQVMAAAHLDSQLKANAQAVILIDVRPAEEYAAGHIPGARNVWRPDFSDESLPYSSITAPEEKLQALFSQLGLDRTKRTVAYDGKMGADAANFCWIMGMCGYPDTRLLDGGLPAWQAAGFALDRNPSTASASRPAGSPDRSLSVLLKPGATGKGQPMQKCGTTDDPILTWDSSSHASAADVLAALHDPETVILDTRTWDEYTGTAVKEGAKKGGHIPGSVWIDFGETMDQHNGCFLLKPADKLWALFAAKGVTPDKKVICYCHSGARSAHTTFVLTRMLGYPSVRNFDGSWEEWSQDGSRPIETGDPGVAMQKPN